MSSQKEIARLARTSIKTVSRVINRDPLVNAETRARIEAIIAETGYQPSQAARMMRSQKSGIIGFIADGVNTTSSSNELVRGAQDMAWESGKQLMLLNIDSGTESARHAETQLTAYRAEAVIYAAVYHQAVDIAKGATPHVLLNCFDIAGRHTAVLPDDYQLAYDITTALIDKGYRRPAFFNLDPAIVAAPLRAQGFVAAGAARGFDLAPHVHHAAQATGNQPPTYHARALLTAFAQAGTMPDVILCGQDMMAMEVYFALSDLGLRIGRDIAVASFDNLYPIAALLRPGLSTMELPYYAMGRRAMDHALRLAENPDSPPVIERLQGRLVARESF